MTALRALGAAFTQAAFACVLIAGALAGPAYARPAAPPSPAPSPSATATEEPRGDTDDTQADKAEGLAGGVAASLANRALDSLFGTIGEAAVWAFGRVVAWVDTTSSPDVTQPWFAEVYGRTYWLSATIALVALVWALTAGALRNGVTGMLGTVPRLLLVVVGLAVAVPIIQTLLEFTDWLTARFAGEASQNMRAMTVALGTVLGGSAGPALGSTVPGFILGLVALIIVIGALLVWLQLIFRTAVIYLLLAAAAFPAAMSINRTSTRPIRKVIAWIVAMAFAKPVIVLALWIGSAPFAAGSRADIAAVLTGAGIMITAVLAPWALFRLFDFAGEHVASAVSTREHPARMRTQVEQPAATYRRTSNAVADRAKAVREHGTTSFSPTRPRSATIARSAARSARIGATAAGGIAAVGAAAGAVRRQAAGVRESGSRAEGVAAATEPDQTTTGGAPPPAPAPVVGRRVGEHAGDPGEHADPAADDDPSARSPRQARALPSGQWVTPADTRGGRDDR